MKFRQSFCARSLGVTVLWSSLLALPGAVSAQVVISEIMFDTPGSDSKAEWVELQNTGDSAVDISKWKFKDSANHVLNAPPKNGSTGSMTIEPGQFLILAADATTFQSLHSVDVSVIDTVMNLPNDGGVIELLNASSAVASKISYTSAKGGTGTGESLQMINGKLAAGVPTPGITNSSLRIAQPIVSVTTKTTKTKTTKTKTSKSKKVASKTKPEILDGTSTVATDFADTEQPTTSAMVAAAVVPVGNQDGSLMSWLFGILALGVAGGGAVLVAKQKKKGEWEIEEIA